MGILPIRLRLMDWERPFPLAALSSGRFADGVGFPTAMFSKPAKLTGNTLLVHWRPHGKGMVCG
jgi:hypothetical protein